MTSDDMALVRKFAADRSERAFAVLVERYIGLVHSTALRQVHDPHLAEEVTQAVFIVLSEYHIDGSARDTIAAFESLRLLGALDRVKDLDQWKFRPQRGGVAKGQLTWHDAEAWVCQQRLARIVRERKENPQRPYSSLMAMAEP
jgi:G:T/U-mismatch repair DNA glycosylase